MKLIDRCINCKYFKEKYTYEYGSLNNGKVIRMTEEVNNFCTHENFATNGIITEPQDFGCIYWENKSNE